MSYQVPQCYAEHVRQSVYFHERGYVGTFLGGHGLGAPPLLKVVGWLVCLRSLGVSHYQDTITLTTRHVCTMVSLPISAGP